MMARVDQFLTGDRRFRVTPSAILSLPDRFDVDLLVAFSATAEISLFDVIELEQELETLFDRAIDLVEREALTNPIRRRNILSTIEPLYAA